MTILAISLTACGSDDKLETNYSVMGTWEITELPNDENDDVEVGDIIIIAENGMIYDKVGELGTWKKGGQCALTDSKAYPVTFTAKVLSLTENFMSINITIYGMTVNIKFKRVS